eukprot:SAG31_NODE_19163_length_610_cov_1.250489_1_plen_56_part_00
MAQPDSWESASSVGMTELETKQPPGTMQYDGIEKIASFLPMHHGHVRTATNAALE